MNQYESKIKVPKFKKELGFYTTKARSLHMSKIRSKDTNPEIQFRKALFNRGIRYRLNVKKLPGKPDLSNLSKNFVVFIDGEFWHGFNWSQKRKRIKKNRDFWIPKIERNIQRDRENDLKLKSMGLKVFHFWEHEVKNDIDGCINQVLEFIKKDLPNKKYSKIE